MSCPWGGLPSCWCRDREGESDRSSKEAATCESVMLSSEVHGLEYDSGARIGATELRNGTRTDSSMSS